MNITTIGSSDAMDGLSLTRTPIKKQEPNPAQSSQDLNNALATDPTKKQNNATLSKKEQEDEKSQPSSLEELEQVAEELNNRMDDLQTSLGFSVKEDPNNQVIVQIRDRKTNEVIRQIPTEELQKISEKMTELTGLLLDHRA